MMSSCLYRSSRPWKLPAWQQWPFPNVHSITRFHDTNGWAELCHTPPQLSWAVQPWCCSRYSQWLLVPDILSGCISCTCRHAHMQVEDLLKMIARLRVFKLPNFEVRGELSLGFWWHINPHVAYKKLMLQGYFLARDHLHLWQVCAWSYGKGWSLLQKRMKSIYVAMFPDLYLMRWLSRFLKRVPKKQVKC